MGAIGQHSGVMVSERVGARLTCVIDGTTHGTSVYVRPVAARRGVGSRLLALAESFGRARGATAVQIQASLGAVEFYKCHGFVEIERGTVALSSGFQMPCMFMRKQLR